VDLFGALLAVAVGLIVLFVARAVRLTRGQSHHGLRGTDPRGRDAVMQDLAAGLKAQTGEVKCVWCGGSTFALPGTERTYKCEVCHRTFDGPAHLREDGG
jgi:hypothetical protein